MNGKYLVLGIAILLSFSNILVLIDCTKANTISYKLVDNNYSITNSFSTLSYIDSSNGLPTFGQWPYATRIGDIDNDGYLDIIRLRGHDDFNSEDQGFQIWLGDGTGNWTKTNIPNGNFGYGGTALGDFNNDGYLDGAYGVHHNRVHPLIGAWAGDGGTSFIERSNGLATDGETWGMAPCDFGDFNNDGFLDLGVGSFGGGNGVRAYLNHNGGNSWSSESDGLPHNEDNPNVGNWLIWADINRDGYLDIVISTQITTTGEEHLFWLGDGTGNWVANDFGLPDEWLGGSYGLDLGDVDNNGWLDVSFIKSIEGGYNPVVYLFDGSSWTEASDGLPSSDSVDFGPLAFGDLNNDGFLDLVGLEGYTTGSWPNTLDWTKIHAWLGDGTGQWIEIDEIATEIPGWPQSVTLADIDHNNYLDIITSSNMDDYDPGGLRCYKNTYNPSQINITIREPLGGEVFIDGGVRKIRWTSEVPSGTSTVSLYYSITGNSGPWFNIVENITDSNYYQWIVPNICTGSGFIKATVYKNTQSFSTINPRPIIIYDGDNFPPNTPSEPDPEDGSIDVNINTVLSWACSDPEGDPLIYDVYLEENDPTPDILVSSDQSQNNFDPETLLPGTIYYWQIIAKDNNGGINGGPIWSFMTEGEPNRPPGKPAIVGLTNGKPGISYTYKFTSTDPDEDDVSYYIKWGDGDITDWTTPQTSGPPGYSENHNWSKKGTYTIEAKAKDINGAESEWSELKVSMPRSIISINTSFLQFLERFPNAFPILRLLFQRIELQ